MRVTPSFAALDPFGPLDWDKDNAGFMQSRFWARFKGQTGWRPRVFAPARGGGPGLLVLERSLRFGLAFAYLPFGPEILPEGEDPASFLSGLAEAVRSASGGRPIFLRVDLPWPKAGEGAVDLSPFPKAAPVQVPDTVILDLKPVLAEILAGMKPKWRYNIKLAERKGVVVSREGKESLPLFYDLYRETSARDGIAIHPAGYYEKLFDAFADPASGGGKGDSLSLWVAREGGQALAAIVTLFRRGHATYLYGASSGEKRNLMPAYALQWSAIQAAKAEGCVDYDFFGIPPDEDPGHPMAGLYLFKTGFGGSILHREGALDIPMRPLLYRAFRLAEDLRLFWHKGIRKWLARSRRAQDQRKTSPSKA